MSINTVRVSEKWVEAVFSQWCPVTRQEAMDNNWNTRGSFLISGNISFLCEWWSTEICHPEKLRSFPP